MEKLLDKKELTEKGRAVLKKIQPELKKDKGKFVGNCIIFIKS